MKPLTTPQAILSGFVLVALAIIVTPHIENLFTPSNKGKLLKVQICSYNGKSTKGILGSDCARVSESGTIPVIIKEF
jgi:hypothetical protein